MRTRDVTVKRRDTMQRTTHPILRTLQDSSRVRANALRLSASFESLLEDGRHFAKRSLLNAIIGNAPAIIAEVKKASPSKGVFRDDFDPVVLVTAYDAGGAAAISVVTEPDHFQGRGEWIGMIKGTCALPILRKDFITDEVQVVESAALGADAILLIARMLTINEIVHLSAVAAKAELEVLYEAHDAGDLVKIRSVDARMIGINARNLDNFVVDTECFGALFPVIPKDAIAVAESGLKDAPQIRQLSALGYRGFLIGESLICSADPARLIGQLKRTT
jgi:indole-3-glycerol phosphate synthase